MTETETIERLDALRQAIETATLTSIEAIAPASIDKLVQAEPLHAELAQCER